MINKLLKLSFVIVAVVILFPPYGLAMPTDDDFSVLSRLGYFAPAPFEPELSSDGKTLYNGGLPVVYVAHPDPSREPLRIPAPVDLLTAPESATATFSIEYVPNGGTDAWGKPCSTFPVAAQAPFNAAAAIWGNIIQSAVPITIRACWADLGSSSILGYSGGGYLYRDFTGAPRANTWYTESLANALSGSDRGPGYFDMHITYNLNFTWYYGTDGQTPGGYYDLMSVVLHEIAHGLNFSGSMTYSSGSGSWGYATGYPNIYDTFIGDGLGYQLINTGVYPNPSTALGTALTSNNIWFHGSNAMAANGGVRVKMYAPSTWAPGSSYSHLDYNTFNDTANELMVYAFSSGESVHDPGPVTKGLFKDLGWQISSPQQVGAKIGTVRNGAWYLDYNGNLSWDNCVTDRCYTIGLATDTPVAGDWNGSGRKKIGVKRGNAWYLDYNGNGVWDGCSVDRCYTFGLATDIPVIGDWDDSGSDKIGVFRSGNWYLDYNGNGAWNGCATDLCIAFGLSTDIPVAGVWDGIGYTKIGVVRNGVWYLDYDGSDSWSGCGVDRCYTFGLSTDKPVIGDWSGSGTSKIGVRRGNAWYLDYNGDGSWSGCSTDRCATFGLASDKPVCGEW